MATLKKYLLTVAFTLPEVDSHKRKAELVELPSGYSFIKYTGDKTPISLTPETFTDLLKLVLPFEPELDPIKKRFTRWQFPELNRSEVVKFLNSWGEVGFCNEANYQNLLRQTTNFGIAHALGYLPTPKEATKFLGGKSFGERAEQIRQRNEVPFPWIEQELRTLAFCARLTNNLFRDDNYKGDFKREEIILNQATRSRIVASSPDFAIYDFKDDQDPAQNIKRKSAVNQSENLENAEEVLTQFAGELNRYLRPLTLGAIITEKTEDYYQRFIGFETAFANMIATIFRLGGSLLICQECRTPYFPKRLREDAKFCGDSCGLRVRNRNYKRRKRQEAKVSATKAGIKKAKPNKGTEKKRGKTK
jgi:hypothetical protein